MDTILQATRSGVAQIACASLIRLFTALSEWSVEIFTVALCSFCLFAASVHAGQKPEISSRVRPFRDIAKLINQPRAAWLKEFGKPLETHKPDRKLPPDAVDLDGSKGGNDTWKVGAIKMNVSWTPGRKMVDGIGFSDVRGVDLPLSECQQLAGYLGLGSMREEKDDDGQPMYGWGKQSDPIYARHWPGSGDVAGGFEILINTLETTSGVRSEPQEDEGQ
jgi:hypothetical protein